MLVLHVRHSSRLSLPPLPFKTITSFGLFFSSQARLTPLLLWLHNIDVRSCAKSQPIGTAQLLSQAFSTAHYPTSTYQHPRRWFFNLDHLHHSACQDITAMFSARTLYPSIPNTTRKPPSPTLLPLQEYPAFSNQQFEIGRASCRERVF